MDFIQDYSSDEEIEIELFMSKLSLYPYIPWTVDKVAKKRLDQVLSKVKLPGFTFDDSFPFGHHITLHNGIEGKAYELELRKKELSEYLKSSDYAEKIKKGVQNKGVDIVKLQHNIRKSEKLSQLLAKQITPSSFVRLKFIPPLVLLPSSTTDKTFLAARVESPLIKELSKFIDSANCSSGFNGASNPAGAELNGASGAELGGDNLAAGNDELGRSFGSMANNGISNVSGNSPGNLNSSGTESKNSNKSVLESLSGDETLIKGAGILKSEGSVSVKRSLESPENKPLKKLHNNPSSSGNTSNSKIDGNLIFDPISNFNASSSSFSPYTNFHISLLHTGYMSPEQIKDYNKILAGDQFGIENIDIFVDELTVRIGKHEDSFKLIPEGFDNLKVIDVEKLEVLSVDKITL